MSHRAAVYTVRVRQKREKDAYRLLGDVDEQGTALIDELANLFRNFSSTNTDGTRLLAGISCEVDGHELRFLAQNGQSGLVADIVDNQGRQQYHQEPDDTQLVRCGCLFRLPPEQTIGWLSVHINNGRGLKNLLDRRLQQFMHENFEDLVLEIKPFVEGSVLRDAVDSGQVDKIQLVKIEQPIDRAVAATNKWVPTNTFGRLELDITPRGGLLNVGPLRRFLRDEPGAFNEIVQFEGITFDEARVEVVLAGGKKRTFNIEKPDAGHPVTQDLTNLQMNNGEPVLDSLWAGLRRALARVT